MRTVSVTICIFFSLSGACCPRDGGGGTLTDARATIPKDPRKSFLEAKSPEAAGSTIRSLFAGAGSERIRRLMNDDDISISLAAAYRGALQNNAENPIPRPERFLGFMEGRTRINIPLRWEVELTMRFLRDRPELAVKSLENYLPVCPFLSRWGDGFLSSARVEFKRTGFELKAPTGTSLSRVDGRIFLTGGDVRIPIDEKAVPSPEDYFPPLEYLEAVVGPKKTFLAFYRWCACPYPLVCVDSQSGEALWRGDIWSVGDWRVGAAGADVHEVFIQADEARVAVLGHASDGSYAEAFNTRDGSNIFRFSTNSWRAPWD
jgi:hypothetical protein